MTGLYPSFSDKKVVPPVKFKKLRDTAPEPPSRGTPEASGLDLRADVSAGPGVVFQDSDGRSYLLLEQGDRVLVRTGYAIELAEGYEGQVRSRSGLAIRYGVAVLNSPGSIDADYRGEMAAILINTSNSNFRIYHGDRIAQLVIAPVVYPDVVLVDQLSSTDRGSNGFGSTGVK